MDPLVTACGPSRAAPAGAPSGSGAAFRSCESYLTAGLRRMQERGELLVPATKDAVAEIDVKAGTMRLSAEGGFGGAERG